MKPGPVTPRELRVIVRLMEAMHDALHEDPPECCGEPAHLFVETEGGELDATQGVPHICAALRARLGDPPTQGGLLRTLAREEGMEPPEAVVQVFLLSLARKTRAGEA